MLGTQTASEGDPNVDARRDRFCRLRGGCCRARRARSVCRAPPPAGPALAAGSVTSGSTAHPGPIAARLRTRSGERTAGLLGALVGRPELLGLLGLASV